jgi:hypothetical protein
MQLKDNTKRKQAEAFKAAINYLLELTVILLDNLEHGIGDNINLKRYFDLWLQYLERNLYKDRKHIDFYSFIEKIKKRPSDNLIQNFIKKHPELRVDGIRAKFLILNIFPSNDNKEINNLLRKEYKQNLNYYKNYYISSSKDPTFKIKEIFIKKGRLENGKYISDRKAFLKTKKIFSLVKNKSLDFDSLARQYTGAPAKSCELSEYGDIYDKLSVLERGDISQICKRKNGYSIFKLLNKNINIHLNFKSNKYFSHITNHALGKIYEKLANKLLKPLKNKKLFYRRLNKYYKLSKLKNILFKNPLLGHPTERHKEIKDLPFTVADISYPNNKKQYLDYSPKKIILFTDPQKAIFINRIKAEIYLKRYILQNETDKIFKLWLWTMKHKLLFNQCSSIQLLNKLKNNNINASSIRELYKKYYSLIKIKTNKLTNKYYRKRLNVYFEVFLDLFFCCCCVLYDEHIKSLLARHSENKNKKEIKKYRGLFNQINTDAEIIRASFDINSGKKKEKKYAFKNVYRIATHDKAYRIIKNLKLKNHTILHFDAHKDLWHLPNIALNKVIRKTVPRTENSSPRFQN